MVRLTKERQLERIKEMYWWIRGSSFNDPHKWDYRAKRLKENRNIFNFNLPENATEPEFLRIYTEACTELKFEAVDSSIFYELFATTPKSQTKAQ